MATFTLEEAQAGETGDDGERKPFTLIPEDEILECEVFEIKGPVDKPYTDDDGNAVKKMEFTFKVLDGEFKDRRVWGETSPAFVNHSNCKLYAWTQEILSTELPAGFSLNTDNLLKLKCRVVVGQRSYTKKGDTEKTTVNFAKDIIRSKTPANAGFSDPF